MAKLNELVEDQDTQSISKMLSSSPPFIHSPGVDDENRHAEKLRNAR